MKKICVYIGGRANYSSIKSAMNAIKSHPKLQLQVLVGASAVLKSHGKVEDLIEGDGFKIDHQYFSMFEGDSPYVMTKSTGMGVIESANALRVLKPDVVLVVGDRFDVLPVCIAAAYMNITLAHTMGGEVTGTIDESIRHAITKFSNIHFPANEDAKKRIFLMGEEESTIFNVGCPRNDLVLDEIRSNESKEVLGQFLSEQDIGLDIHKPFILLSQHPVTTEHSSAAEDILQTLRAADENCDQVLVLYPNADAGRDQIRNLIDRFVTNSKSSSFSVANLPIHIYIHLMNTTSCLVGNSSSGIREGALIGTPVVNIGTRQNSRLAGKNVISVPQSFEDISKAIGKQLKTGRYAMDPIYGDGAAGPRIADVLADWELGNTQKVIRY